MLPQASHIIKARKGPVLLLFLMMSGPMLIAFFINPSDKTVRWYLLFVFLICMLFYFFNSRLYLYLDNDVLIYKTALFKKEVRWRDLIRSDVSWVAEGAHSASLNWSFVTADKFVEIRLGLFSRSDMQLLAQQLIERAQHASLSKRIYQFLEGKFPWYLF